MEPKLTQRAMVFDECFDELSEKAQHDLTYRLFAMNLYIEAMGEMGAKELIVQVARLVERLENGRQTKSLRLSDMSVATAAQGLPSVRLLQGD